MARTLTTPPGPSATSEIRSSTLTPFSLDSQLRQRSFRYVFTTNPAIFANAGSPSTTVAAISTASPVMTSSTCVVVMGPEVSVSIGIANISATSVAVERSITPIVIANVSEYHSPQAAQIMATLEQEGDGLRGLGLHPIRSEALPDMQGIKSATVELST